ncbi:glutathione S-transferase theta-1 [Lingula anatina]|uniref:glutathione transferase n=1 Tax=Lingula anatina TaxID=7574 RepID=A0A1S3JE54_LINAN|nr:glutathione S-transferase theta-1 [Lingula anatina]|eukprot:XP_013408169.1 glutathione S-transferase theta-1 [Lingula anatina]
MVLKYYYDLMSQPARAVYLFLKATGIQFQDAPVALRKGEHLTPEYKKINPFQRVPVIDDDGFLLTESVAILRYLIEKHKVDDHWYPRDLKQRARIDEYIEWQHANTRFYGAMYFQTRVIIPRATGQPVNEGKAERFRGDLDTVLDHIENVFLKDTKFIRSNDDISIADLLAVCELWQPIAGGYDFRKNRPILRAYMERVRERMQPHFDSTFKFIYKVYEMNSGIQSKL